MTGKMELLKDLHQRGVTPDNFFRRFQTMAASNVTIKPSKHRQGGVKMQKAGDIWELGKTTVQDWHLEIFAARLLARRSLKVLKSSHMVGISKI